MRLFFGKQQRIVRRNDITRAIQHGVCAADQTVVLFALPTAGDQPGRLGVTIPKKAGNAVVRNRWKRLIRESYRTQQQQIPTGFDYVIRPKKGAVLSGSAIKHSVLRLAHKATQNHAS